MDNIKYLWLLVNHDAYLEMNVGGVDKKYLMSDFGMGLLLEDAGRGLCTAYATLYKRGTTEKVKMISFTPGTKGGSFINVLDRLLEDMDAPREVRPFSSIEQVAGCMDIMIETPAGWGEYVSSHPFEGGLSVVYLASGIEREMCCADQSEIKFFLRGRLIAHFPSDYLGTLEERVVDFANRLIVNSVSMVLSCDSGHVDIISPIMAFISKELSDEH